MQKTRLLPALCATYRVWRGLRRDRREFIRWLKAGRIDFTDHSMSQPLWASQIKSPVLMGANGIIYCEQRLRGLHSLEKRDDFWDYHNCGAAISDWVAKQPHPPSPDDTQYAQRYSNFSRIDCFHVTEYGTILMGGLDSILSGQLEILQDVLSTPWRLTVIPPEGQTLRSNVVQLSLCNAAELRSPQDVGVQIKYESA